MGYFFVGGGVAREGGSWGGREIRRFVVVTLRLKGVFSSLGLVYYYILFDPFLAFFSLFWGFLGGFWGFLGVFGGFLGVFGGF